MGRRYQVPWPTGPGTVFFNDVAAASKLSRAARDGLIRRLAYGLYTADLAADPVALVTRHRWPIIAHYISDALLADRSAAQDGRPADDVLYVVSSQRTTPLSLPGLTVVPRQGPGPLPDDPPWAADLHVTSDARTLVDNLALTRGRTRAARTLTRPEIEQWLVHKMSLRPAGWLTHLRERAIAVAEQFRIDDRIPVIEELVGQVAGTRPVRSGGAELLIAHTAGRAWDPRRLEALGTLAGFLADLPAGVGVPDSLPPPLGDLDGELPFYEAYFSNFIEGTEFTVEEARRIIESGQLAANRPQDAHDILGTYRVISDPLGRAVIPSHVDQLLEQLRARHSAVMGGRPEKRPGQFKTDRNQAGSYVFVEPDLVEGTLAQGFPLVERVPAGFPRAAFMLFLISEVHPFDDGNGRVARTLMNAELSAANQARIVIPIVWRNEYMTALRALSRDGRADLYVRTLAFAWRWTAAMPWHDRGAVEGRMAGTNALIDSTDAERAGVRLQLP